MSCMLTCYTGEVGRVIAHVDKTLLCRWVGIRSFCLGRHYKHYPNSRGQGSQNQPLLHFLAQIRFVN
jgi:hypothetical protein